MKYPSAIMTTAGLLIAASPAFSQTSACPVLVPGMAGNGRFNLSPASHSPASLRFRPSERGHMASDSISRPSCRP